MQLNTAFVTSPHDDDLLYSTEHWNRPTLEAKMEYGLDHIVEAFVHPKTGTAARIMEAEKGYSVQPSMGDFGPFDKVIQPDDPSQFTSGGASVTMAEIETLSEARAVAYAWMRGWVMRESNVGDQPGQIDPE